MIRGRLMRYIGERGVVGRNTRPDMMESTSCTFMGPAYFERVN